MIDYLSKNALSILSLVISSYILLSNKRIMSKTYRLNRAGAHSETIKLLFIESQQNEKRVFLKLVLFNPANIAAIINSFAVYQLIPHPLKPLKYLGFRQWKKVEDALWWPSYDEKADDIKTLKDEYASLYVEDYRNIFVTFSGYISRDKYKFFIHTNHGSCEQTTNINAIETYFSFKYREWYSDS